MADKLHFSLVSPERELYSGLGGVLAGHAPFMATLREGRVIVRNEGRETIYEVRGGFADVTANGLTILAEHAVAAAA